MFENTTVKLGRQKPRIRELMNEAWWVISWLCKVGAIALKVPLKKKHARDFHVITHALSLMRVTLRLASSRLLHATQSCWYEIVAFREWNIYIYWRMFCLKIVIGSAKIHPDLYQQGHTS